MCIQSFNPTWLSVVVSAGALIFTYFTNERAKKALKQSNPPIFKVDKVIVRGNQGDEIEVIIKNIGKPLALEDVNWLSISNLEGIKNDYSTSSNTECNRLFMDRDPQSNPNNYLLYSTTVLENERLKLNFQHIPGAEKGTGADLNYIIKFKDIQGDEFQQTLSGKYYHEIKLTPYSVKVKALSA